jgi:two-component system NarL family sensor kinase
VTQLAATGLASAIAIGVAGTLIVRHQALNLSLRDARDTSRLLAGAVGGAITDRVVAGDPVAVARLDAVVRARALHEPIVRVKLWTASGRIVYSDERRLIGSTYTLHPDDLQSLRTGRVAADLSDLTQPENRFERSYGKLLEVYLPVTTPSGQRLLLEPYFRYTSVLSNRRKVFVAFAPAMIAALIALWLVQLPIAWSVTRRLRRGQEEREELLVRAIDASDAERRRIASDLHDTVVQELLGVSYTLEAGAQRSPTAPRTELRQAFHAGAAAARESSRRLRSLLVEIYPADLRAGGLAASLNDLARPLAASGIETEVTVDKALLLDEAAEELVFRAAQEALRNVTAHASPGRVEVALTGAGGRAILVVRDDGRGFDETTAADRRSEGHVGLTLLADRARSLGGVLAVHSKPGAGTTVRLELPLQ